MAIVKTNPAKTETKIVEIEPETFTLTLTREEAQMIASVTGEFVASGLPYDVYRALGRAGIRGAVGAVVGLEGKSVPVLKYTPEKAMEF